MEGGRVYVVYNDWIQNPEAEEGTTTYKIGITAASAKDRLYGLGLKMPSEFESVCEYEFDDGKHKEVEKTLHSILSMSHAGGEWFDLDEKALDGVRSACKMFGGRPVSQPDEEEAENGEQAEIDPFLGKVVTRWNEASDMKAVGNGRQKRHIHIPGIGSGGRQVRYYFDCFRAGYITIGLRGRGIGLSYPAVANLFQEPITIKGITFEMGRYKGIIMILRTYVPQTTDVDRVVEIMQSLIEATKDKIVGGWGKE